MAVAFDAVGTAQQGAAGTSASIPITLGGGPNRAVIVQFTGFLNTTGIAANIVGGEVLSVLAGTDGGVTTSTVILGTTTTLSGAVTISVSWTTSQGFITNAVSFTGASAFNGGTFGTGLTPFSLAVTSVNGDLTTTIASADAGATGLTTNQTLRWGPITQGTTPAAGDTGPGTGTTTHTWSDNAGNLFASGVNIVAAVGGVNPRLLALLGVGT